MDTLPEVPFPPPCPSLLLLLLLPGLCSCQPLQGTRTWDGQGGQQHVKYLQNETPTEQLWQAGALPAGVCFFLRRTSGDWSRWGITPGTAPVVWHRSTPPQRGHRFGASPAATSASAQPRSPRAGSRTAHLRYVQMEVGHEHLLLHAGF